MPKVKYRYNPETLQYERLEPGIKERLLRTLPYLTGSMVFAIVIIVLYENQTIVKSPKEQAYERELSIMRQQFDLVNKDMMMMEMVLQDLQRRDDSLYRVVFEAEPYPLWKRQRATGGSQRFKELENLGNGQLIRNTRENILRIEKKMYAQSKSFDEINELSKRKEQMLASIPAIIPIARKNLTSGIGPYGWRIDPIYKTRAMHTGMDFPSETGTKVYSTGDGKVESVESNYWGYGNIVIVNHGFGYKTLYAHLSGFNVKPGQKVKRGEVIGFVGSTGKSTAPHLHYEVLRNGEKVNPVNYYYNDLSPREYEEMLQAAALSGTSFD